MDYQVACPHCKAGIAIMAVQIGRGMRCPHCHQAFTVSDPNERDPAIPLGRVFSFRCRQCQSRLEAYTGMVGQGGQCPTCAVEFEIPPPETDAARSGGTEPEMEYAQPVHAYAAAGDKAPEIIRMPDGKHAIRCPRCHTVNAVDRNNCIKCAAPFTLEGAERGGSSKSGGLAVASLVSGIVGVPGFRMFVPSLLAIIFGLLALRDETIAGTSRRGMAIAGIVLGAVGLAIALFKLLF